MTSFHLLSFIFHSITILVSASFQEGFSPAKWSKSKNTFRATEPRNNNEKAASLSLPIFPLRKKIRLPTETLTLNLYEERYLTMAESILDSKCALFGAVFASDKPQIVSRGTGPIVPLIDPGDVGVLFIVTDHAENMIPTVGGIKRRRIRLVATAIGRFEAQSILNDGYSFESSCPFIVADTRLFCDVALTEQDTIDAKEQCKFIAQNSGPFGNLSESEFQQILELSQQVDLVVSELELASFALASNKIPEGDTEKRQILIQGRCTLARFSHIQSSLR
jgi:hypothetical protein